ncbi:MAG: hypothetical protein QOD39_705 [Mycobacterium sp.]|jgi:hypothetical protein|nr:hypothetical protein [Mycobacterium sp.]
MEDPQSPAPADQDPGDPAGTRPLDVACLSVRRQRLSNKARTTESSTTSYSCSVDDTDAAFSRPAILPQCLSSSSLPISGAAYSSPT